MAAPTKDHIDVKVAPRTVGSRGESELLVFRVLPDTCQSLVMGSVWLEFSYAELGITRSDSFTVGTSMKPWTGPGE